MKLKQARRSVSTALTTAPGKTTLRLEPLHRCSRNLVCSSTTTERSSTVSPRENCFGERSLRSKISTHTKKREIKKKVEREYRRRVIEVRAGRARQRLRRGRRKL